MEDFFYKSLNLYNKFPLVVRNTIGVLYRHLPFSFRYGPFYKEYLERISQFENVDVETGIRLHDDLVVNSVNYAIDTVPFYAKY
ncbi:MAG: hypothetical protein PHD30_09410, partial [Paludibacter sp.]|nr:hypothetical protein [Paludibacter sp.]